MTHYLSDLAKQIVRRALAGGVHGDGESRVQSAGSAVFRLRSAGLGLIDVGPVAAFSNRTLPVSAKGAGEAEGVASPAMPGMGDAPASAIQGGVADE